MYISFYLAKKNKVVAGGRKTQSERVPSTRTATRLLLVPQYLNPDPDLVGYAAK